MNDLRNLPAVEQILRTPETEELVAIYGRPLVLEAVRTTLLQLRQGYQVTQTLPGAIDVPTRARSILEDWLSPTLIPVINATGVILHTNLGRAPLSLAAQQAMLAVAGGYSNLEFNLLDGKRGSRTVFVENLLQRLTGAEAALVVNNNAAAVLLALTVLARNQRVIISRTQLVEIGGGFRVPDVMKQSGAKLVEIGTTNRVHRSDYEEALAEPAAMVLRAHPSNFRIIGFTSEPSLAEMAEAAHARGVLLMDDLGSGALLDTAEYGMAHEPTVMESLAAGADVVCFSGDKLLGGPQAGILLGNGDLIAKIKKHPLTRAVRADKLCLAALAATLLHYLKDEAKSKVPVWRMISMPVELTQARAQGWVENLGQGSVVPGESTVGGGSLPGETLPTALLALGVRQPNRFLGRLREQKPAIIARVQNEQIVFDPRTVPVEQDENLLTGIRAALAGKS